MKRILGAIVWPIAVLSSAAPAFAQESLLDYVTTCSSELGFSFDEVPEMNCNNGFFFDDGDVSTDPVTNDYIVSARVNDEVDVTAACRWLGSLDEGGNFSEAVGLELLIHNRLRGGTCFFSARRSVEIPYAVSTRIVSPTNFSGSVTADEYWEEPEVLNSAETPVLRCVNCHTAGPYIASPKVVPFLGLYGLLTNGHDTFARDSSNENYYHAVGSTFSAWNDFIHANTSAGCAGACHTISTSEELADGVLARHITQGPIFSKTAVLTSVLEQQLMPSGQTRLHPNYRWMNLDIPDHLGTGDWETYGQLRQANLALADCALPEYMEARAVGSEYTLKTSDLPNVLEAFDPIDGLICRNSDQDPATCEDYEVNFVCPDPDDPDNEIETGWTDVDDPSYSGDVEPAPANAAEDGCRIEARVVGTEEIFRGFRDKLYRFDRAGFSCINDMQVDDQCDNYTVRYVCPDFDPGVATIISEGTGTVLTETFPLDENDERDDENGIRYAKGQPLSADNWASQDWIIEPIAPSKYVRLRSSWTNLYLNVSTEEEGEEVNLAGLNPDWWSEQWEMVPIFFFDAAYFVNRWTGRLLTVGPDGPSNFLFVSSSSSNLALFVDHQLWRVEYANQ